MAAPPLGDREAWEGNFQKNLTALPKIPGLGDVRWRDFFSAFTSVGYRGPVCIEVEDRAYEGSVEDVQAALLTSRNYLRRFWG